MMLGIGVILFCINFIRKGHLDLMRVYHEKNFKLKESFAYNLKSFFYYRAQECTSDLPKLIERMVDNF